MASNPLPLYSHKALIAGQEARMEGFSGHPDQPPRIYVWLTQHPLTPALEKCSVKLWRGNDQSKHRAQGRTDEPGQCGTMINLCPLTPLTFDLLGL